jgi:membrane-associated phospholipid phosphatase
LEEGTTNDREPLNSDPLAKWAGKGNLCALTIVAWVLTFAIALLMDSHVALFARNHGIEDFLHTHKIIRESLKAPGEYWFTILIAVIVGFVHRKRWKASLFILLATAISGVNGAIKWMVGRTRPFKLHDDLAEPFVLSPLRGGIHGMMDSKNLCFPSGHAALAFATAASAAILWPRFRWAFYAIATCVAFERIAENAHWLSDNVAAAALGIGGVGLIRWIWWRKMDIPV